MTGYRYKSVKNLNKSVKVRGYLLRFDPMPNAPIGWETKLVDSFIADLLKKKVYASGIKADLSIDDKETSGMEEWFFKSENSTFLINQREVHKYYW